MQTHLTLHDNLGMSADAHVILEHLLIRTPFTEETRGFSCGGNPLIPIARKRAARAAL